MILRKRLVVRKDDSLPMSIIADYHLHSSFSGDSDVPMERMIERGIILGLGAMCFTEHMDMDYPYTKPEEEGMFDLNTDSYLYDLLRYRFKYQDLVRILFGVELGVQPHLHKELSDYVKNREFDFVIASSHLCNRKDPYEPSFYEGRSDEEAYREYFSSIMDNLNVFSDFDVYGHLDYVVRYGKTKDKDYSYEKYRDLIDPVLEKLIQMGKGIEVNTGAIRHQLKELNPCNGILKRYRELGGEIITIGSDAHEPSHVAYGFDRAAEVLKECGFQYYTTFERRIPTFLKL